MIIVHDIFICKPGNASKVAKLFKEVMANNEELVNIMTDMSGQYNRVVMVSKYDSLSAFEASWKKYEQNTDEMKKMREKMAGYTEMYLTGSEKFTRCGERMSNQRILFDLRFACSFLCCQTVFIVTFFVLKGNYIPVRPKVIKLLLLIDLLSYMKFTKLWLLIRKTTN